MGVVVLPEVDSTNTYARSNFADLPDGTLIAAREQLAGRGRLGRKWFSIPGAALTATGVFKNVQEGFHAGCVIGLAGLALAREVVSGGKFYLKWPNDIYCREKKVAGVLAEGVVSGGKIAGIVCGIGMNINQSMEDLAQIGVPAASLYTVGGSRCDLDSLYHRLDELIALYYNEYKSDPRRLIAQWCRANALVGETLTLISPAGGEICGRFAGIGSDGAMQLETDGGTLRFDCGDVKIDTANIDFESVESRLNAGDKNTAK